MLSKSSLQFQDSSAMELSQKKHFGIIFAFAASLPFALLLISPILMHQNGFDILFVLQIIGHFSPLSIYDIYSVYSFFAAYLLTHLITRRCYKGMDVKMTEFVQLYASSMRGVVTEGTEFIGDFFTSHMGINIPSPGSKPHYFF